MKRLRAIVFLCAIVNPFAVDANVLRMLGVGTGSVGSGGGGGGGGGSLTCIPGMAVIPCPN
jgi:hypothetical protein